MVVHKESIRTEIIEVASKIFTRFGYRKTTMEEIAMACSKGKSSIYYYFKSKEDIFRAVVEKEANELRTDLQRAISSDTDPHEKLKKFILFRMHKLKTLSNFYSALNNNNLEHLDFIHNIRKKYDQDEITTVTGILNQGIKNGEFIIDDPELASVALVTAMKGLEIPLFIKKEHGRIEDRLDNFIKILFYGLVKRE